MEVRVVLGKLAEDEAVVVDLEVFLDEEAEWFVENVELKEGD